MNKIDVDVAVIGAGSAGLRAFRAAGKWTNKVVLIEGGQHGTTCARVGCMPSKLLIAASEAAHASREAPAFGIDTGTVKVDGVAVMNRVRSERDRFVSFVVDGVYEIPEEQRIQGYARFLDNHRLQIEDHTIVNARRIVIATGSTPSYPGFLADLGDRMIVNDDVFSWNDLPDSVAIFGPGVIGLELGQALNRLGVRVLMFGRGGPVGPLTDPEVLASAQVEFSGEFSLDADANVKSVSKTDEGVQIDFVSPGGDTQETTVDYVIAATGRSPSVSRLGLHRTSLPLDADGVPVFDQQTMRIGQSHVFIAGDVADDRPVLHEAADEGVIAGDNAGRYPDVQSGQRSSPLGIVFTDPQIAMVGSRYTELADQDIIIGKASFANQGRSRVMLKNHGLLRVYADAENGRFLGAEMLGPRAEHIGHLLAWSHQSQLTIDQMEEMPFYHPVIEEGVRGAVRDAARQLQERLGNSAKKVAA